MRVRARVRACVLQRWVDIATRALVLDVTVWNPGQQLLSAVKLQVEVTVTGRLIPRHDIKTFAYHIYIYYIYIRL